MSNLFLRLLNISITAGWIVLVIVLLRFVLKKAPKWIRVALWGLVAVRLLLPVSIESVLSLVPSAETVKIESVTVPVLTSVNDSNGSSYFFEDVQGERVVIQSGVSAVNIAINPIIEPKSSGSVHTVTVVKTVAGWVWLGGAVAMLLYALISYLRLKHKVRASVKIEKGVYMCDEIGDPDQNGNGDGKNDRLVISGLPPVNNVIVFDAKGKEIISFKNYRNDWQPDDDIADGYYYYIVKSGSSTVVKQALTIKRSIF